MTTPTEADLRKAEELIASIVIPRPNLEESVSLFRVLSGTEHQAIVGSVAVILSKARREGAETVMKAIEDKLRSYGEDDYYTGKPLFEAAKEAAKNI